MPVVDAGSAISIAHGTSTTLDATVTGAGPFTYSWSPSLLLVDASLEDPTTVNLTETTVFTLTATSQVTGCSSSSNVTVTVTGSELSVSTSATPTVLCLGASTTLEALASGGSGSYLYSWSSTPAGFTSTELTVVVSPTETTTYAVTVDDGYNTISDAVTITVNALPPTPLVTVVDNCNGTSTLSTTASGTLLWSTGVSTTSIIVSIADTYTVTTTVNGCTSEPGSGTAAPRTTPSAPIVGDITQPTCSVGTGSVELSGLPTGTWTLNPGNISGTTTDYTVIELTAGTYTFTVTNAEGCISVASGDVVIETPPAIPSAPVIVVNCSLGFNNAIVSVTSPVIDGDEFRLNDGPYQTSTVFPNVVNGSYTVTVRNAEGCETTSESFEVSCGCVDGPTLTLGSTSGSTCGTTPITVSGNQFGGNATSVTITTNGTGTVNPTSTSSSSFSFTYTPGAGDAGNTITITVTTNNPLGEPCVAATATYTLTVLILPPTPIVTVVDNCDGTSTLSTTAEGILLWNTGAITSSITVSFAGTYTVTTTAGECTSLPGSGNAAPNETPTLVITSPAAVCSPATVDLTTASIIAGSTAGLTYSYWQDALATEPYANYTAATQGTYYIKGETLAGCYAIAPVTVVVNSLPEVYAGSAISIAHGTSTTLDATVTGAGPFTYSWSPPLLLIDASVEDPTTVNLTETTIFTLTATSQVTGCSSSSNVTVTVTGNALSVGASTTNDIICLGGSVTLSALASGGTGNYDYSWSSDPVGFNSIESSVIVTPIVTTTYFVTVNDGYNDAFNQVVVTVNSLPSAIAGVNRTIMQGQNTTIGSAAVIGSTYAWTSSPSGFTSSLANPTVMPSSTTTYTVVETIAATGCSNSNSVVVTVNPLPESFIPVWWPGNGLDHMNIYILTATLDGINLQPGDAVGVFDGSLCVGVGVLTVVLDGLSYLSIIASLDDFGTDPIDGYTVGNPMYFKIWDASENREISYVDPIYIMGNGIFTPGATTTVNLTGYNAVEQSISLASTWNIMSFAALPDNMSLMDIVYPLIANGTLIKVQDETGKAIENIGQPIGWINDIGLMSVTEGYRIKLSEASVLNIIGRPVGPTLDIPLSASWNIIGFPFLTEQPALAAFEILISEGSLIKVQNEQGSAIEELDLFGWVDHIGSLIPGKGYRVRANSSTTLTLSNGGKGLSIKAGDPFVQPAHFRPAFSGNGLDHMNIYIVNPVFEGMELKSGDEIGVFDGDLCVGVTVIEDPLKEYITINASFNDPTTQEKDGFAEGQKFELRVWCNQTGIETKSRVLNIRKGLPDHFVKGGTTVISPEFVRMAQDTYLAEAFPNPSDYKTTFSFTLARKGRVQLEIINNIGTVVAVVVNDELPSGTHMIEWFNTTAAGNKLLPGIYHYRLRTNDYFMNRTLIIQ